MARPRGGDTLSAAAPGAAGPLEFLRAAERFYAALGAESLGGRLLYSGALDGAARALLVAANVAGAASLAVAADAAAQKLAARDGIADFLVTSLDEALRILKNEIRKRATVAVCVGAAAAVVEREMLERGVEPDLVSAAAVAQFTSARVVEPLAVRGAAVRLEWQVSAMPALWMPTLDAMALECVPDAVAQRWLRLAPRYAGRAAMGLRVVRCSAAEAEAFSSRVGAAMACGEIGVPVEIRTTRD